MSELQGPSPCLCFASFLYRVDKHTQKSLSKFWTDSAGESFFFQHPHFPMKGYYSREMGSEELLGRFFAVSTRLFPRSELVERKKWSTKQEKQLEDSGLRSVNIDTGIITPENLLLGTGKNFVHRIFLQEGVYADLTLMADKNQLVSLPWTYPDYSHPQVIEFFSYCRRLLLQKISQSVLVSNAD